MEKLETNKNEYKLSKEFLKMTYAQVETYMFEMQKNNEWLDEKKTIHSFI